MTGSALVLAGSRPGSADPVAQSEGVSHKALVRVGGRTLLERVVAALKEAGADRILVCADDPEVVELAATIGGEVLRPGPGPSASVAAAFETGGAPLLVTTADHGLLEARWVRELVDGAVGADVGLMMAARDRIEAAAPQTRRTWMRFADGDWSGCNLFLLSTQRAKVAIDTWAAVEANRKRPWRIAARLGPSTLASYLLGRLSLDAAVARLGSRIGIVARVVNAVDGKAAIDVDTVDDLALVRALSGQG